MNSKLISIEGVLSAAVAANIKKKGLDLAIILLPVKSQTAAVFTKNIFCAAPITIAKNNLTKSPRALLINSGNANAGTGKKGIQNTILNCKLLASKLNIKPEQVLPFSTGVIGKQINNLKFNKGINEAVAKLNNNTIYNVAKSILTTDLVTKTVSTQIKFNKKTVTITGIAKGSGMIKPNMATLLSFIFTDVVATQDELQKCLNLAVKQTFNRITIDGDTSTNDACTLSATGSSLVNIKDIGNDFQKELNGVAMNLAHKIVKDGEGASKFVEVCVIGGASNKDCLEVAYTVAHSPLVKTALFASDANWGRILAAVGRANINKLKIENIDIYINKLCIIKNGEPAKLYTEHNGNKQMAKKNIKISIKIGHNKTKESIWTTDLSFDYIKINAEYRT